MGGEKTDRVAGDPHRRLRVVLLFLAKNDFALAQIFLFIVSKSGKLSIYCGSVTTNKACFQNKFVKKH